MLIVATLSPAVAVGTVTLYDGSTLLDTGDHYSLRWSYSSARLAAGSHTFTATFAPDDPTAFAGSTGSLTYVMGQPVVVSSSPTPSPAPTPTPSPTPTRTHSPRPSPTPSATDSGTSTIVAHVPIRGVKGAHGGRGNGGHGGSGGPLPFTGLNAIGQLIVASVLIGAGLVLAVIGRRRRRNPDAAPS